MLDKKIDYINFIISGIFFIIIGILLLVIPDTFIKYLFLCLGIGLIIFSILNLINFTFKKKKNWHNMPKIILNFLLGIYLIYLNYFFIFSISVLFGIYLFLFSLIHLINYFIYRNSKIKGKLKILLQFLITLILALLLIFKPSKNISYFTTIISIYLIILGINYIMDFILDIIPQKIRNKFKNRIKIELPVFITAFIPQKLINLINETLTVENSSMYNLSKNDKFNIEVLIHLAPNGSAKFGHIEIAINDIVYSYGNYDNHSRNLFDSIGDGVFAIADKNKYIEYQVTEKNRYIVSFGIKLNDTQMNKINKRINTLVNENTVDWYPDLQKADLGIIEMNDFKDMSSAIYKKANGSFKKIIKGKNKRFFVLNNNCAMVAQSILQTAGTSVFEINGLICPGTYYEYLNREFMRKESNVISRKVYTKYDYIDK